MQPLDILKAARERIAKPENWTQGAYARCVTVQSLADPTIKTMVALDELGANCWCAVGAVRRVNNAKFLDPASTNYQAIQALAQAVHRKVPDADPEVDPLGTVTSFNDTHDHDDVLAIFDDAIAHLEQEDEA
jgi:hypothetical protein